MHFLNAPVRVLLSFPNPRKNPTIRVNGSKPTDDSTLHVTSVPLHSRSPISQAFTSLLQIQRLPGWYKQRDEFYYPAWAYVFPTTIQRIPYSLLVAATWSCMTYFTVGLAPEASRCAAF